MRLGIAVDSRICMACYCCYLACKDEHCSHASALSAPAPMMGQHWMDIREKERGDSSRRVKSATVPTLCAHCQEDAPCMKAAGNDAVYKRPDGIVIIDPVKAKGMKKIADACPIGAVYWNEELKLPQKCTMCAELIDDPDYLSYLGDPKLKRPRCVEACPNKALIFGDLDDPKSEISEKIAQGRVTPLKGLDAIKTNVVHLNIPSIFLAGTVYLPGDEVAIGAKVSLTCKKSGKVFETVTNWAGDWEIEDLPRNREFDITIEFKGFKSVKLSALTDTDRYVAETLLEAI